jgi:hypothetical protein
MVSGGLAQSFAASAAETITTQAPSIGTSQSKRPSGDEIMRAPR